MRRSVICFRTERGGVGRHPVEPTVDPVALVTRLAALVGPAEWWVEAETSRRPVPEP